MVLSLLDNIDSVTWAVSDLLTHFDALAIDIVEGADYAVAWTPSPSPQILLTVTRPGKDPLNLPVVAANAVRRNAIAVWLT